MIEFFADAPQAALTQLVQLVVLCIPLFILPMVIKNASSIMGKIGNAADKTMKNMGVEKGLGKAQGGIKKMPVIRSGFETMEQRKQNKEYGRNRAKLGRATRRATRTGARTVLGGLPLGEAGRASRRQVQASARGATDKLFQEDVGKHAAEIAAHESGGDETWLRDQLIEEARNSNGDAARARALQRALVNQGGLGVEQLHQAYENIGALDAGSDMERALQNGAGQDFGDVAKSSRSTGTWQFANGSGTFGDRVTPEQLSAQSIEAMDRYEEELGQQLDEHGNPRRISSELASRTLESPAADNLNDATYQRLVERAGPNWTPPAGPGGAGPIPPPIGGPAPPPAGPAPGPTAPGGFPTYGEADAIEEIRRRGGG